MIVFENFTEFITAIDSANVVTFSGLGIPLPVHFQQNIILDPVSRDSILAKLVPQFSRNEHAP